MFKIFKNKTLFLSAGPIFSQEIDHAFYPFSTSRWRMFDIVRERSVCIT